MSETIFELERNSGVVDVLRGETKVNEFFVLDPALLKNWWELIRIMINYLVEFVLDPVFNSFYVVIGNLFEVLDLLCIVSRKCFVPKRINVSDSLYYHFLMSPNLLVSKSFNWGNGICTKAMKYSISTLTRYLIKLYSEKYSEHPWTFDQYLPSTGEIAVKVFKTELFDAMLLLFAQQNKLLVFYGFKGRYFVTDK